MREFNFYTNLVLTSIALLLILLNFTFETNDQANIIILLALGIFQVCTSLVFTIISVVENKYLLTLFIIYWVLVIVFFKFIIQDYFYFCLVIALYNLYVHYCSFSKSKYNITKL
jgi:hypothetical protein